MAPAVSSLLRDSSPHLRCGIVGGFTALIVFRIAVGAPLNKGAEHSLFLGAAYAPAVEQVKKKKGGNRALIASVI